MDIDKIIKELTIEEKAELCMGADSWNTRSIKRLGIPAICMADGPHGLRKQAGVEENPVNLNNSTPATCFPPASLASCSFDRSLIYKMGEAIGEEAVLQDVDIVLGPAVNIKRSPLCGRNFEYVSEDPYLTGEYGTYFIKGVQSTGAGTSIKHFALNNQESLRMNIDVIVDRRALREIYLYAFEKAVKSANPYTVMGSYNRINGEYGCENEYTLRKLLREEWGYKGLVVSDWSAINDRVKGLMAGCDLEMPNSGIVRTMEIVNAVRSGKIGEDILGEAVKNILQLVEKCRKAEKNKKQHVYDKHNELARKISAESMVLLKNENDILPLDYNRRYALIGAFADTPRYQGGGSSHITPTKLASVKEIFEKEGLSFSYSQGYDINSEKANPELIMEAAENAAKADMAIVFIGLTDIYEYEGLDRKDMSIAPSHIKLLDEVYKSNKNIIAVLCTGSPVEMDWEKKCSAILYAGVMGQAGSYAVYDILFGRVNPSGKLTETFPMKLSDTPCYSNFPGGNNSVRYMESIFVGYRYYSTAKVPVKYPFGYGLSYTCFEYSDLKADREFLSENDNLKLCMKVRNTGSMDGAEVVQIYVQNNCHNTFMPELELKNFEKVYLKRGEEKEVIFQINYESFMRYDEEDGWVADSGEYSIFAGSSSEDLRLCITVNVKGKGRRHCCDCLDSYYHPGPGKFNEKQFSSLYGSELPPLDISYKPIDMNTPLAFCAHTLSGKILLKVGNKTIDKSNPGDDNYAARKALKDSLGNYPIRSMVVMNGDTDLRTGQGLVKMMTGRFFSGLKDVIKSIK